MRFSSTVTCLVIAALVGACDREKKEPGQKGPKVEKDTTVTFASHLGNTFVAPSQFVSEDKGDTFSLKSPDGHAVIHAIMFTAEGSGSIEEFRQTLASSLLPKGATGWEESKWEPIAIGDDKASKRSLVPIPASDVEWRIYAFSAGKFYYAIILNASATAMALNGGFYESIVRTFHAVRE